LALTSGRSIDHTGVGAIFIGRLLQACFAINAHLSLKSNSKTRAELMAWMHSASSYLAISQLLFLACLYLVYFPGKRLAHLIALFCFCLTAYILSRQPELDLPGMDTVLGMIAVMAPAVLWVIARYMFEDNPHIHKGIWILIVSYLLLRAVGLWLYDGSQMRGSLFFLMFFNIPQLIMMLLACHVVYMASRGRDSDLVELRRQLRMPFAVGMGSIVGLIIGSGFFMLGIEHPLTFRAEVLQQKLVFFFQIYSWWAFASLINRIHQGFQEFMRSFSKCRRLAVEAFGYPFGFAHQVRPATQAFEDFTVHTVTIAHQPACVFPKEITHQFFATKGDEIQRHCCGDEHPQPEGLACN
jgi:hypothetical protein